VIQASVRAQQIMLGALPDQRRQHRVQLPVAAHVFKPERTTDSSLAYMRDINVLGAFLFCDLKVKVGETVQLELKPAEGNHLLNLDCEARVVRVEECPKQGVSGIAVEFHGFKAEEPCENNDDATKPFLHWSLKMVDQMFARRPELQSFASRIQGAA
jgi:hypothetical protein